MKRACVFLRGINVNGIRIKMNVLASTFTDMGYGDVKTILATGNVLISVSNNQDIHELKCTIENRLREVFQYDAHVLIRDHDELLEIVTESRNLVVPDDFHLYLLICESRELQTELLNVFNDLPSNPGERLIPVLQDCFWTVSKGNTVKSTFGSKILGSKKYKTQLTSRNMNTIGTIARL